MAVTDTPAPCSASRQHLSLVAEWQPLPRVACDCCLQELFGYHVGSPHFCRHCAGACGCQKVPPWTEEETGEYINTLAQAFRAQESEGGGYVALCEGVAYAKARCSVSNRIWLDKLLATVREALRGEQGRTTISTTPVRDQEWEDESMACWWYQGVVVCYLCGDDSCETTPSKY